MEEKLKPKQRHNFDKLSERRYITIKSFSEGVLKKYNNLINSILVKKQSKTGEAASETVDIILFIDDLNNIITNQQSEIIRSDALESAYSNKTPDKITIKSEVILASELWAGIKSNNAETLEILREGIVFHDNGFLSPLQDLLLTGKIRPSKESQNIYFVKAENSIKSSTTNVSKAVLDLYWAVIDTAHAAVMAAGITPPSPKELAETFRKELVMRNLIHKRCADIIEEFYNIAKKIMHKEIFEITGKEFDKYLNDAQFFIRETEAFVKMHELRGEG
jgi:uncharacterized protein (UPF0332 family)